MVVDLYLVTASFEVTLVRQREAVIATARAANQVRRRLLPGFGLLKVNQVVT